MDIYWPAGTDYWVDASANTENQTGIYRWKIPKATSSWYYEWKFQFSTNVANAYAFYDESDDRYAIAVYETTFNHYIYYNSKQPNMVHIDWRKIN